MNEHNLILLILVILIVTSIVLAYCAPVDVSTDAQGIVRTNGTLRVTAQATGKVVNVYLRQGQPVHAGDALLQLDTRQIDHELQVLQTRIHLAEIRLRPTADETSRSRLRNLYRQLALEELARTQLTVISPADGLLDKIHAFRIGEPITDGTEIATIIPSDRDLTVEARISESVVEFIHVGQAVSLQTDNRNHEDSLLFPGVVQNISQEPKPGSSNLEYIVSIAPKDDSWLRYEKEFRVKFLLPRERLLKLTIDRLADGLGNFWRRSGPHQPGSADPAWLSQRLRRAG